VLNRRPAEHEYVTSADALELLPGVAGAVRSLERAGYLPIVVSNQRGIARGLVSEETLRNIERRLLDAGVPIAAFYYCRHDVLAECNCRKPRPGLLLEATADYELDLSSSLLIGDEETDVAAGRSAGCRTIRIGAEGPTQADEVASDLPAAADIVARRWPRPVPGSGNRPVTEQREENECHDCGTEYGDAED
jgi:D-glycero-D-manno-heptose 1,7-bisphosphate phosphatase